MRGLGIILLIVLFFWLVWPVISRWLKRKAMDKAEDYMWRAMGMPPGDRKKRGNKKSSYSSEGSDSYNRQRRNPFEGREYPRRPIIPKEYAEDVEFVETKEYSHTEIRQEDNKTETTYRRESQISDAEWTEIKKSGSK